jgi:hypothetical protein
MPRPLPSSIVTGFRLKLGRILCLAIMGFCGSWPIPADSFAARRELLIPILSHTLESRRTETVAYVIAGFDTRSDRSGLLLQFKTFPGRFSRTAKASIEHAIRRTAQSLNLSTDSWSVVLTVPYPETTIYGEDLSAMIGLSVAAMATGRTVAPGMVMTATITPEGQLGPVGSKPLKIPPTGRGHLRRVLVSKDQLIAESDEPLANAMQVSPMSSVSQAFQELTAASPKP